MNAVPLIYAIDEGEYGGKAVSLGEAARAALPVPPGYALDVELVEALARGRGGEEKLNERFLSRGVAVRSSAVGEDAGDASFAGQHLTVLNVTTVADTVEAIGRVYDSAYSESALAYRRKRGLGEAPRIGVVVQRLLKPEAAGVLFTRNPVTGRDERVIEAAWGLGEVVVSGLVTPDTYRVARDGKILEIEPGEKHVAIQPLRGGGTEVVTVDPEGADIPCLDREHVGALVALAARSEEVYGPDLDLEWALAGGRIHLLQCRAITTLEERSAA